MQGFLLKTLVLLFMGLAVGLAASWNTKVKLHLDPQPVRQSVSQQHPASSDPGVTAVPSPGKGPSAPAPTGDPGATVKPPSQPAIQPSTQAASKATPAEHVNDYFISLTEAKKKYDAHSAIFVDARTFTEFKEGHIPGSMHCAKSYFDGAAPKKVLNYLPGSEVVVYCHGAECTDSEAVVKRLQALNLNIGPCYIIKDGFPGWKAAGLPVDTGDEVGFE